MRKGNNERKKSLILVWKIKSEKREELKCELLLALVIRQEAGVKKLYFNSL